MSKDELNLISVNFLFISSDPVNEKIKNESSIGATCI
jgi:hypothetical protein